jgi:hypothetical protein
MTTPRFSRDYILRITAGGLNIEITPPIQIVFDITKSIRGGINKMNIQITNLAESKRLSLVKDAEEGEKVIPVALFVGYQDRVEMIFKGTVQTGGNARQGPDIITSLECLDGGKDSLHSFTARTVEGGRRAIDACVADMPRTKIGKITERPPLTRPKVLIGNSARLIEEMMGPNETSYIDDEQLYAIKDDEVVRRYVPVVSAATGMISTPTRDSKLVTFETLMNPSVKIGGLANLKSSTAPHLDGIYKIETINYRGDNYGDEWKQSCTGTLAAEAKSI